MKSSHLPFGRLNGDVRKAQQESRLTRSSGCAQRESERSQTSALRACRYCYIILARDKARNHVHAAKRHVEHYFITKKHAQRRNDSLAPLGVQLPHPFHMAREVPLDHEVRNHHLVEQRWARSKQFCGALEALEFG